MIVTHQKEEATAVNVKKEADMIQLAVAEVMAAVTVVMGHPIVMAHHLIVVMAPLLTVQGQQAMEPPLRGPIHQGLTLLEVG